MLIVLDFNAQDPVYEHALDTIHAMVEVVDALSKRAKKIQ